MNFKMQNNIRQLTCFILLTLVASHSHDAHLVKRADPTPGASTLLGENCGFPFCTVTPSLLSSLTVLPTPVTILPPGALLPVVISFEAITTRFSLISTLLNKFDPANTLTLGSTTISGLKATATADYAISLTESLSFAVVVEVEAKAQLLFGFNTDEERVCELFPDESLAADDLELSSRSTKRGIEKRALVYADITGKNKAWVRSARSEAFTVLKKFLAYGRRQEDQSVLTDIG